MNKKIIMSIVAVALVVAIGVIAVGCGNGAAKMEFTDTADVINKVVDTYTEENKFFAVGGDINAPVDGKAGLMNLADTEVVNSMLHTNDELLADVDEVASFVHAMNANTFTSGAFKLKSAGDAESFAASLKESVLATQWMCGFPEKIVIVNVNGGDYVVYAIGNGEAIDYFKTQLTTVMGESAVVVAEEAVA
ncbi:MAG: hypothetical protein E7522_02650 [Ruminococcaceae bacterium]|nr:hypothetical protein [Oscillospiraceae bacterium]